MANSPQRQSYFTSIDGLRLVASINIVLFHLEHMGALEHLHGSPGWLFALIKGPAFHASLFFILGGFLYTAKFCATASSFDARRFVWKRFKSLYPLHVVTTLAMVPITITAAMAEGAVPVGTIITSVGVHLGMLWSLVPLGTFSLNTPSWALSAFFLCYALFGPALKLVSRLHSRRLVVLLMTGAVGVIAAWWLLFTALSAPHLWTFFHIFAPIRLCEFLLGMLLARLYHLNNTKPRRFRVQDIPFVNDCTIIATCLLIALFVRHWGQPDSPLRPLSYHVFMLPLYATILYRMARGNGLIATAFAFRPVRILGMCSFYPYLIHIPVAAWGAKTWEYILGWGPLLHSPVNVIVFLVLLYSLSALAWQRRRVVKNT